MKQFLRNFRKQKTVGILSICGLSLGIMCSLVIGLWSIDELTVDNFHKNGDRIYRVNSCVELGGEPLRLGSVFKPLGEEAQSTIPGIEDMCRVVIDNAEIWIDNVLYSGNKLFLTDGNFFTFFTFPLIAGDPALILSNPDALVVSEKFAKGFFPDGQALGKTVTIRETDFTVAGIMKNMPVNSHLQADLVCPFFGYTKDDTWGTSDSYNTYFFLKEGADKKRIEDELLKIYVTNMSSVFDLFKEMRLQPLQDIYFGEGMFHDQADKGNKQMLLIFILVTFVILVVSCINFANLFVSTAFIRAKSIGVKKAQGALRGSLIYEFYFETACYVFIATAIGLILACLSVPVFNRVLDAGLVLGFTSTRLYVCLAVIIAATVLIAGSFPALYMTKFGIIQTLREKFTGRNMSVFQKSLVVLQFSASISLLIIIMLFNKQVRFMITADLGFDRENVVYVFARGDFGKNFETFKADIMKEPSVADVTKEAWLINQWNQGWAAKPVDGSNDVVVSIRRVYHDYFDFFDMDIIDGTNSLDLADAYNQKLCLINETAAKVLGFDDPVGKELMFNNDQHMRITGVVRDANTGSLHNPVDPQAYFKLHYDPNYAGIYFKIAGDPRKAIDRIRERWENSVADVPFEYRFLDSVYEEMYRTETNAEKLLIFGMFVSFFITIAGLFAMAYYSLQRRIKEIGIRKVNGAKLSDLLLLLGREFMVWIAVSFVIACLVSYFFVDSWLDNFVLRIGLSPWVFLAAGLMSFIVAMLTVGYQTWKAATMNPVDALKNE